MYIYAIFIDNDDAFSLIYICFWMIGYMYAYIHIIIINIYHHYKSFLWIVHKLENCESFYGDHLDVCHQGLEVGLSASNMD